MVTNTLTCYNSSTRVVVISPLLKWDGHFLFVLKQQLEFFVVVFVCGENINTIRKFLNFYHKDLAIYYASNEIYENSNPKVFK